MNQKVKKSHFKKNESYKHRYAIKTLDEWLENKYLRTAIEDQFAMGCEIWFVADLGCYDENGLSDIYEVVHKHDLTKEKIGKMIIYFNVHDWQVRVWRVDAEWIMRQVGKPKRIKADLIINHFKNL